MDDFQNILTFREKRPLSFVAGDINPEIPQEKVPLKEQQESESGISNETAQRIRMAEDNRNHLERIQKGVSIVSDDTRRETHLRVASFTQLSEWSNELQNLTRGKEMDGFWENFNTLFRQYSKDLPLKEGQVILEQLRQMLSTLEQQCKRPPASFEEKKRVTDAMATIVRVWYQTGARTIYQQFYSEYQGAKTQKEKELVILRYGDMAKEEEVIKSADNPTIFSPEKYQAKVRSLMNYLSKMAQNPRAIIVKAPQRRGGGFGTDNALPYAEADANAKQMQWREEVKDILGKIGNPEVSNKLIENFYQGYYSFSDGEDRDRFIRTVYRDEGDILNSQGHSAS